MKMCVLALSAVVGVAAGVQGQSLQLTVEFTGLEDGILTPDETLGVTVRAQGTGGADAYRALAALYGFSMSGFVPGTFTQTGQNAVLTSLPGSPGLVYDNDAGTVSMLSTGGFVQLAGILPTDNANPVYLFSFDWAPASFNNFWVDWSATATNGAVYVGGDVSQPVTWVTRDVTSVGGQSGSFGIPAPSAAVALGIAAAFATRRRR